MAERSIASDCKSDASRLRWFKSNSPQIKNYRITKFTNSQNNLKINKF